MTIIITELIMYSKLHSKQRQNQAQSSSAVAYVKCQSWYNNVQSTIKRLTSSNSRAILRTLILAAASTRRDSVSVRYSRLSANHHSNFSFYFSTSDECPTSTAVYDLWHIHTSHHGTNLAGWQAVSCCRSADAKRVNLVYSYVHFKHLLEAYSSDLSLWHLMTLF